MRISLIAALLLTGCAVRTNRTSWSVYCLHPNGRNDLVAGPYTTKAEAKAARQALPVSAAKECQDSIDRRLIQR